MRARGDCRRAYAGKPARGGCRKEDAPNLIPRLLGRTWCTRGVQGQAKRRIPADQSASRIWLATWCGLQPAALWPRDVASPSNATTLELTPVPFTWRRRRGLKFRSTLWKAPWLCSSYPKRVRVIEREKQADGPWVPDLGGRTARRPSTSGGTGPTRGRPGASSPTFNHADLSGTLPLGETSTPCCGTLVAPFGDRE